MHGGRRAIAIGARRPMRFVQGVAALAAIALAVVAIRSGRQVDWYAARARASPMAWLMRDASRADSVGLAAAEEPADAAWIETLERDLVLGEAVPAESQIAP